MQDQKIRVCHLLQKHSGSRNPVDRLRNKTITRSKAEAIQIVTKVRSEIEAISDLNERIKLFQDRSFEMSECSSAQKGGDLGFFGRNQMQKNFEDAAFALEPYQMSQLVDTDSGIHIILRLE